MIKEDIRVGNIVQSLDGTVMEVCLSDFVEEYETGQAFFHMVGVKPTEAILTNLGFGKCDEHEMSIDVYWGDDDLAIVYDYHFHRCSIRSIDFEMQLPKIKAVHQIQNLFYSLKGEELTIKK